MDHYLDIIKMGLLRRLQAKEAEIDMEVAEHWRDLEGYVATKPRLNKVEYQRRRRWMKRTGKLRAA